MSVVGCRIWKQIEVNTVYMYENLWITVVYVPVNSNFMIN